MEKVTFNDDKIKSLFEEYYIFGALKQEINYKNGMREYSEKWYYESGAFLCEVNYINDKVEGLIKLYYESGE